MKTIVVTGGFGFIGFHLSSYLLEQKKGKVIVIDRNPDNLHDEEVKQLIKLHQKQLQIITADVADYKKYPKADEIYHLAGGIASKGVRSYSDMLVYSNVTAMTNLLAAYGNTSTRILFVSSNEVAGNIRQKLPVNENCAIGWTDPGDPRWYYSISKFICEELLIHYPGITNYTIARLGNVYGERMRHNYVIKSFIQRVSDNEDPFKIVNVHDSRSFTYISDIIQGLVRLMESKYSKEIFLLSSPKDTTIGSLAKKIVRLMGKKEIRIEPITSSEKPDFRRHDISKAKKLLHWTPTVSLEEGLKKTIAYYQKNH